MAKFSVVLITYNEAKNIRRSLTPLLAISDDVIVVDAFSEDDTVEIAKEMGASVYQEKWEGYAYNKNLGLQKCKYDWVLSIDADEVVSEALAENLKRLIVAPKTVYQLDRITCLGEKWIRHGGWYPDWKARLFNRREIRWQGDFVHETLNIPPTYQLKKIEGQLFHYSFEDTKSLNPRLKKYASLGADQLYEFGRRPNVLKKYLAAVFRWFKSYFIKRGFLDGGAGWQIAAAEARMVYHKYQRLEELFNNNK